MRKTNRFSLLFRYGFVSISTILAMVFLLTVLYKDDVSETDRGSELREAAVSEETKETSSTEDETADSSQNESIYVYVCGEVCAPGVYELQPDSRVYEAIEAAGGMTDAAAFTYLNQAELLNDGQQLYVPSADEAGAAGKEIPGEQEVDDGKINLNTAAKEELMTLTGVGEVKAEAIIRYREANGGFASIEELKEVEGIKEGVFNKVKDQVKVSQGDRQWVRKC